MKKSKVRLITACVMAIALFAGTAHAQSGRTETHTYNFPSVGHGDVGGVCFIQSDESVIPPELWSCVEEEPLPGETHVDITVVDNDGADVYFSAQQENNPNFAVGCGRLSEPFPVIDRSPGGGPAPPVFVFPWAGPGLDDLDPPCIPGSTNLGGGTVTFVFLSL